MLIPWIDISYHQLGGNAFDSLEWRQAVQLMEWSAAKEQGVKAVQARLGIGMETPSHPGYDTSRMIDGSFEVFTDGFRGQGLKMWAYFWPTTIRPADAQLAAIRLVLQRTGPIDGPVALDCEDVE